METWSMAGWEHGETSAGSTFILASCYCTFSSLLLLVSNATCQCSLHHNLISKCFHLPICPLTLSNITDLKNKKGSNNTDKLCCVTVRYLQRFCAVELVNEVEEWVRLPNKQHVTSQTVSLHCNRKTDRSGGKPAVKLGGPVFRLVFRLFHTSSSVPPHCQPFSWI